VFFLIEVKLKRHNCINIYCKPCKSKLPAALQFVFLKFI